MAERVTMIKCFQALTTEESLQYLPFNTRSTGALEGYAEENKLEIIDDPFDAVAHVNNVKIQQIAEFSLA